MHFFCEFAQYLSHLLGLYENIGVVFVPHIFRDYQPISAVIEYLPDYQRRQRIAVAPYLVGSVGSDKLFSLYQQASLVLAMRFHANVCPLGLGVSTLGLVCYPQISHLYRELGMTSLAVDVTRPGFSNTLITKTQSALNGNGKLDSLVFKQLDHQIQTAHKKIDAWLLQHFPR